MTAQLILLNDQKADWRIDDRTKEIGRKGIADARAVLRDAARRRVAA
jgi:hypothetical protein